MKLFRTISMMLVILTAIPISVVGYILIDASIDSIKTMTLEIEQERAYNAGRAVSGFIDNIKNNLDLLASQFNTRTPNLRQRQELLSFILQKHPEINVIGFYDEQGQSLPGLQAFDTNRILPSELAYHQSQIVTMLYHQAVSDETLFSTPYAIERRAQPRLAIESRADTAVAMAVRINANDAAYIGMEISLRPVQQMLTQIRVGHQGEVLLIDRKGFLIAHHAAAGAKEKLTPNLPSALLQMLGPAESEAFNPVGFSGARAIHLGNRDVLVAYAPLLSPPWLMVSVDPLEEAYASERKMTFQVVPVVLISMVIAVALGMLFTFGITRPISKCVKGALAIARGDFGFQVDIQVRNEIGELAHTFNYMSRQLQFYDRKHHELRSILERGYLETIRALANSIDAKDPYTRGHSMRVTNVALAIGRKMDLNQEELRILRFGGILHDIGKIGIPEYILCKKDKLTDEERKLIMAHPILGAKIIEPIDFLHPVQPIVLHHHEWMNGTGYPNGLKGNDIPLGARIVSAADTYDAVTSQRPYQRAVTNLQALEIIKELRGRQLDGAICDALSEIIQVQINSGEVNPQDRSDDYTDPTWASPPIETT